MSIITDYSDIKRRALGLKVEPLQSVEPVTVGALPEWPAPGCLDGVNAVNGHYFGPATTNGSAGHCGVYQDSSTVNVPCHTHGYSTSESASHTHTFSGGLSITVV